MARIRSRKPGDHGPALLFGARCDLVGPKQGRARRDPTRNSVQYGRLSSYRKRLIVASDPLATRWSSSQSTPRHDTPS